MDSVLRRVPYSGTTTTTTTARIPNASPSTSFLFSIENFNWKMDIGPRRRQSHNNDWWQEGPKEQQKRQKRQRAADAAGYFAIDDENTPEKSHNK